MRSEPAVIARVHLPADPAATFALGERLGRHLRRGQTVALVGDLGAGKTTFARGIGAGLEVDDPDAICSPTYLLVVEHPGPRPLLHADAYLPQKLAGFLAEGGLDYLLDANAVVIVEWADRIVDLLPAEALWVHLTPAADGGRDVTFRQVDPSAWPWLTEVAKIAEPG
ncbi:MAG: tRNA (adenosine(37)-N6)-threonylcarbamoyltransferase complex ATPase subunit type 1 TsaE [Planctomycetes bacterium]|nr:tRNA (adenosine(37)-N6)-threonylcarbamoyltransferase complex ATPase subunit type 1 TsaE [Planctomycetota bacterium]